MVAIRLHLPEVGRHSSGWKKRLAGRTCGGAQEGPVAMAKGVAVCKQQVRAKRRPVQAEALRVPHRGGIRALSSFVPGPQRNVDEKPSRA